MESHQPDTSEDNTDDAISDDKMYEELDTQMVEDTLENTVDSRPPVTPEPSIFKEKQQELHPESISRTVATHKKSLLTELLPDPGYFAAGGLAGVVRILSKHTLLFWAIQ